MPVPENEISFMEHSYQEIDAAVDQVATNTAAISEIQTGKADKTALNKDTNALAEIIDTIVGKNLMPQNSGTTTGGYFCENLAISVPAGQYVFTAERDTEGEFTIVLKSSDDTELYRWSRASGVTTVEEEITLSDAAAKISIYVGSGVTVSDVMLCKKVYYDISDKFVPYV